MDSLLPKDKAETVNKEISEIVTGFVPDYIYTVEKKEKEMNEQ